MRPQRALNGLLAHLLLRLQLIEQACVIGIGLTLRVSRGRTVVTGAGIGGPRIGVNGATCPIGTGRGVGTALMRGVSGIRSVHAVARCGKARTERSPSLPRFFFLHQRGVRQNANGAQSRLRGHGRFFNRDRTSRAVGHTNNQRGTTAVFGLRTH